MSGLGIGRYTDEDVDPRLARQLTRLGYDALSCHEAGFSNQAISDLARLEFATAQQRAIVVFNIRDYVALDAAWRSAGREHWGIILAQAETPLGELLRRVRFHLDTIEPSLQRNAVLFLAGSSPT